MLDEIVYWIFNMSISAALCGIPIVLIRLIKKIPRRIVPLFWLIPFLRLCVPVGLSAKYGLMSFLSKFTTKTVVVYESPDHLSVSTTNHIMAADTYFPLSYKVNLLENIFSAAAAVWLIVFLAIVLTAGITYAVTASEIKDAKQIEDGIFVSEKISTPAVYGIVKPRILLPIEHESGNLRYVLMHERAHVRRMDNLTRLCALAVVALHWFNPLAWWFLKLLYADLELACDEEVLAKLPSSEHKNYAHTLLSEVEKTTIFASAFGGAVIRTRIDHILSYKKMSALAIVGSLSLLIAIAYVLLTNAA